LISADAVLEIFLCREFPETGEPVDQVMQEAAASVFGVSVASTMTSPVPLTTAQFFAPVTLAWVAPDTTVTELTLTTTIVTVVVQLPEMAVIVAVPAKLASGVNVAVVPLLEKLHPLHSGVITHDGMPPAQLVAVSVIGP